MRAEISSSLARANARRPHLSADLRSDRALSGGADAHRVSARQRRRGPARSTPTSRPSTALLRPEPLARAARTRSRSGSRELDGTAVARPRGAARATLRCGGRAASARGARTASPSATAMLRDPARFFDAERYARAVETIEAALRVISAAHARSSSTSPRYRTPFALHHAGRDRRTTPRRARSVRRLRGATTWCRGCATRASTRSGMSVCFPGQLQPAYAFALKLKRALPDVHLTCGGPGITQMLIRLRGPATWRARSVRSTRRCVFEGEQRCSRWCARSTRGGRCAGCANVVHRDRCWAQVDAGPRHARICASCRRPTSTGCRSTSTSRRRSSCPTTRRAAATGASARSATTAWPRWAPRRYRERGVDAMRRAPARALASKYGTRYFYFSQDSVAPKTLLKLAQAIAEARARSARGRPTSSPRST